MRCCRHALRRLWRWLGLGGRIASLPKLQVDAITYEGNCQRRQNRNDPRQAADRAIQRGSVTTGVQRRQAPRLMQPEMSPSCPDRQAPVCHLPRGLTRRHARATLKIASKASESASDGDYPLTKRLGNGLHARGDTQFRFCAIDMKAHRAWADTQEAADLFVFVARRNEAQALRLAS